MVEKDDEALVRELRGEEGVARGALEELVRRHVDFVYSAARRQVGGDEALAEDVTQAVFVLLGRKRPAVAGGKLLGWLFNTTRFVARNAVKMEMRRRKHERVAAGMRSEIETQGQERAAEWAEVGPVLDQAVAKLGGGERDVVLLHYFQNMTLADAARKLGISEAAARQRSSRAVGKLREMLAKQGVTCSAVGLADVMRRHAIGPAPEAVAAKAAGVGITSGEGAALATAVTAAATAMKIKIAAAIVGGALVVGGGVVAVEKGIGGARPQAVVATSTDGAINAPDLSGVKKLRAVAKFAEEGFPARETELLIDLSGKGQVAELYKVGGETYVTWFDGTNGYTYKQGGDLVVRNTHGGYMTAANGRRFIGRFASWVQAGAKRDATLDVDRPGGGKMAAYQLTRWQMTGNRPATVWVDTANRPIKSRSKFDVGTRDLEAEWDRAPGMPTGLPDGVKVVEDNQLLEERYPTEKALTTAEAASYVLAVHSVRRDSEGNYHVLTSARPSEKAKPLVGSSPAVNFVARPDGEKSKAVHVVSVQELAGVTVRELVVVPGGKAKEGVCEFEITMMPWGEVTQTLQEKHMPISGMAHVEVAGAQQGGSFEMELKRTFDRVAGESGAVMGGVVTEVRGTIPNGVPAAHVGWEKFKEVMTRKVMGK